MDLGSVLLEVGLAVASGIATASVAAYRFGKEIESIRQKAEGAAAQAKDARDAVDKQAKDVRDAVDKHARATQGALNRIAEERWEDNQTWRDLNRTLGRIQERLGIGETATPPMRPRRPSQPGD